MIMDGSVGRVISRDSFAADGLIWPLAVDQGVLWTLPDGQVVFSDPDGVTYAVNGRAKATAVWAGIAPIWADDPELGNGTKVSMRDLASLGLRSA